MTAPRKQRTSRAVFLGQFFVEENNDATSTSRLVDAFDDHQYAIHERDPELYLREPADYLDEWAAPEHGWLRKLYPVDSDEVHYDAKPAIERAFGSSDRSSVRARRDSQLREAD